MSGVRPTLCASRILSLHIWLVPRRAREDRCTSLKSVRNEMTKQVREKEEAPTLSCRSLKWSRGICDKPDSVFRWHSTAPARGDHSSGIRVTANLKRTDPGVWRGPRFNTPLFVLAPRRVWLFSLRQLPRDLPFPISSSMPRTFSLFHCSSPCGGGSLTPTLPYGVRTFLSSPFGLTPLGLTAIARKSRWLSYHKTRRGSTCHPLPQNWAT